MIFIKLNTKMNHHHSLKVAVLNKQLIYENCKENIHLCNVVALWTTQSKFAHLTK